MSMPTASELDPSFLPAADDGPELDAMARAIRRSQGFALLFARCNQAEQRERLMQSLEERLHGAHIQRMALQEPVDHLLHAIQRLIAAPSPDAVFVYGLETWLPSGRDGERSPFVRNLNAARNNFEKHLPCPLVLWIPEHLLTSILRGAPDFASVRSGLFTFAVATSGSDRTIDSGGDVAWAELAGLTATEKQERLLWLRQLLKEQQDLPADMRDPLAEARLLNRIATLCVLLKAYRAAEPLIREALATYERALGPDHPITANEQGHLGYVLLLQGRLQEAEPLLRSAATVGEGALGPSDPQVARAIINRCYLLEDLGQNAEAECQLRRLIEVLESSGPSSKAVLGQALHAFAALLMRQGKDGEAASTYRRTLALKREVYGDSHPETAATLNNLAMLLKREGRLVEAEKMLRAALEIVEEKLGIEDPDRVTALMNLKSVLVEMGQRTDAAALSLNFFTPKRTV